MRLCFGVIQEPEKLEVINYFHVFSGVDSKVFDDLAKQGPHDHWLPWSGIMTPANLFK